MRKPGLLLLLLQFFVLLPLSAQTPADCTLCTGVVGTETAASGRLFTYTRIAETELATFTPARAADLTLVVDYTIDSGKDPLLEVEHHTETILQWAKRHGTFDGLGVSVSSADPAVVAYAVKRLAVSAQGLDVAKRIVLPRSENLATLFDNGAQPYFDALIVNAPDVESTLAWLAERDPSKKVFAIVPIESPNALYDLGKALAAGATRAYASGTANPEALARFNRGMTGDWAYDSTAKVPVLDAKGNAIEMPVLSFVRGEDLRTVLIARGDAAAATILSLPADRYSKPRRLDAAGEREITDTGRRGAQLLVGSPAVKEPFVIIARLRREADRQRHEGNAQRRHRARHHRRGDHPQPSGLRRLSGKRSSRVISRATRPSCASTSAAARKVSKRRSPAITSPIPRENRTGSGRTSSSTA